MAVKSTLPEWVQPYVKTNQEVKKVRDKYYLYKKSTHYDKERGRSVTKTECYLGRITEEYGLIPKGDTRKLPRKKRESKKPKIPSTPTLTDNVEYGVTWWMEEYVNPLFYSRLEAHFGDICGYIVAIAYTRLVYRSPICDMQRHFSHSFLHELLPNVSLVDDYVRTVLKYIGEHRSLCVDYFNEFIKDGDNIIFDGTVDENDSKLMCHPQNTKLKTGEFANGVTLMLGLSISNYIPIYLRALPGDIKDVKAIRLCKEEISSDAFSFLADMGFTSKGNIKMLVDSNINFILPLRRNTKLDYSRMPALNVATADGAFLYEGRHILYIRAEDYLGQPTYIFLDDNLKCEETADASERFIERRRELDKEYDKKMKAIEAQHELEEKTKKRTHTTSNFSDKPNPPKPSLKEICDFKETSIEDLKKSYAEKSIKFGTIAIAASDRRLTPEDIYVRYKERGEVEQMIDAFKNILAADVPHMQDQYVYEGWLFCNFVALQMIYVLKKQLREKRMTDHHSIESILEQLQYVHIAKLNGNWTVIERTEKRDKTLEKLGISITYEK